MSLQARVVLLVGLIMAAMLLWGFNSIKTAKPIIPTFKMEIHANAP